MPENSFRFRKNEKLCSDKSIEDLFKGANSFAIYPFRLVWKEIQTERVAPVQTAISVGKKKIRMAVKRNLIKRRTREAFRLNKNILYNSLGDVKINMMFIYMSSTIKDYEEIEIAISKILQKLAKQIRIGK